jgi:hypothetical protein
MATRIQVLVSWILTFKDVVGHKLSGEPRCFLMMEVVK